MDRDELSRITAGILKMLVKATQQDRIDFDEDMAHEQIFYLLAPILADAEKWRKVKEIAKVFDIEGCEGCPMIKTNYHICGNAWCVVNAIEVEAT